VAVQSEVRARAISSPASFEQSDRSRAVSRAEAVAGAVALMLAFLLMTCAIIAHAFRG
jgi:hypothetical protein